MPATRAARRDSRLKASAAIEKGKENDDPYAFQPHASARSTSTSTYTTITKSRKQPVIMQDDDNQHDDVLDEMNQEKKQSHENENENENENEEEEEEEQEIPEPRRRARHVTESEDEVGVDDVPMSRAEGEEKRPEESEDEVEEPRRRTHHVTYVTEEEDEQVEEGEVVIPPPEPEPEEKETRTTPTKSRSSRRTTPVKQPPVQEDDDEPDDMPIDGGDDSGDEDWHEGDAEPGEEEVDYENYGRKKPTRSRKSPRHSRQSKRSTRSRSSSHHHTTSHDSHVEKKDVLADLIPNRTYEFRHKEQVDSRYKVDEATQDLLAELKAQRLRKERQSRLRRHHVGQEEDYADIREGGSHTAELVESGEDEPADEDQHGYDDEQDQHSDSSQQLRQSHLQQIAHEENTIRNHVETPNKPRKRRRTRTPNWKPGQAKIIKRGDPVESNFDPDDMDESLAEMDDFVVDDAHVDYVEEDEDEPRRKSKKRRSSKKAEEEESEIEVSPVKRGIEHEATLFAKLHNQRDEEETQDFVHGLRSRTVKMDEEAAFNLWLEYLGSVLIDPNFSHEVETGKKDLETKFRYKSAIRTIEQQFNTTTDEWVMSKLWTNETPEARYFRNALNHLPYVSSVNMHDPQRPHCNICSGRKHVATYKIKFFGYRYRPDALKHPWNQKEIIDGNSMESSEFSLGTVCHGRVRLYHAMKHFKFHVMAAMKKRFDAYPNTILADKLHRLLQEDPTWKKYYFDIWNDLKAFAEPFVKEDSRTIPVDVDYLTEIQDPDSEVPCPELFSYHIQRFSLRRYHHQQKEKQKMNDGQQQQEDGSDGDEKHESDGDEQQQEIHVSDVEDDESDDELTAVLRNVEKEIVVIEDSIDTAPTSSAIDVVSPEPHPSRVRRKMTFNDDVCQQEDLTEEPTSTMTDVTSTTTSSIPTTTTSTSTSTSTPKIDATQLATIISNLDDATRAALMSQLTADGSAPGNTGTTTSTPAATTTAAS